MVITTKVGMVYYKFVIGVYLLDSTLPFNLFDVWEGIRSVKIQVVLVRVILVRINIPLIHESLQKPL